jgi:hypothetical protein
MTWHDKVLRKRAIKSQQHFLGKLRRRPNRCAQHFYFQSNDYGY